MFNANIDDCGTGVPTQVLESFAKLILPDILTYFESAEGQREFVEWQQKQSETSDQ